MNVYDSELIQLKNIGAASVNILHAVGIQSVSDLHEVGAVETYVKIKQRGINVSKVMLYALQGALTNTHWSDLSHQQKADLIEAADTLSKQPLSHRQVNPAHAHKSHGVQQLMPS